VICVEDEQERIATILFIFFIKIILFILKERFRMINIIDHHI